jgi:hypothetical protein
VQEEAVDEGVGLAGVARTIVRAAHVAGHPDVALEEIGGEAAAFLHAGEPRGGLVSQPRGAEDLDQAEQQESRQRGGDHQLDEGDARLGVAEIHSFVLTGRCGRR